jgi:hypothetical protein
VKIDDLRKAVDKTFAKREYKGNILETISVLKESEIIKRLWDKYRNKYDYSKNVTYEDIMQCIDEIISVITPFIV